VEPDRIGVSADELIRLQAFDENGASYALLLSVTKTVMNSVFRRAFAFFSARVSFRFCLAIGFQRLTTSSWTDEIRTIGRVLSSIPGGHDRWSLAQLVRPAQVAGSPLARCPKIPGQVRSHIPAPRTASFVGSSAGPPGSGRLVFPGGSGRACRSWDDCYILLALLEGRRDPGTTKHWRESSNRLWKRRCRGSPITPPGISRMPRRKSGPAPAFTRRPSMSSTKELHERRNSYPVAASANP